MSRLIEHVGTSVGGRYHATIHTYMAQNVPNILDLENKHHNECVDMKGSKY